MRSSVIVVVACCFWSVCAQDQLVKVSLDKRPLSLDQVSSPQRRAEQLGLLHSSNGGEDIPILNFLDAQVRPCPASRLPRLREAAWSHVPLVTCSTMVRSAWEVLPKTSWLSLIPAAPTFGCPLHSAAGSALLVTCTTSTMLPTLLLTRWVRLIKAAGLRILRVPCHAAVNCSPVWTLFAEKQHKVCHSVWQRLFVWLLEQ